MRKAIRRFMLSGMHAINATGKGSGHAGSTWKKDSQELRQSPAASRLIG